jgi:hypothetical protein
MRGWCYQGQRNQLLLVITNKDRTKTQMTLTTQGADASNLCKTMKDYVLCEFRSVRAPVCTMLLTPVIVHYPRRHVPHVYVYGCAVRMHVYTRGVCRDCSDAGAPDGSGGRRGGGPAHPG